MTSLTDSISLPVAPGVPETRIPRFGLGVYESEGEDCYNSVLWALEVRSFDYKPSKSLWLTWLSIAFYSGGVSFDRVRLASIYLISFCLVLTRVHYAHSSAEWYENEEESGRAIRGKSSCVFSVAISYMLSVLSIPLDRLHAEERNS